LAKAKLVIFSIHWRAWQL